MSKMDTNQSWGSAEQVFVSLNDHFEYLVIRNFENFYDELYSDTHADIDLLCRKNDKNNIVKHLGAVPRLKKEDGIHYQFLIGELSIPLDLRCVGDGYYDTRWEKHMLDMRIKDLKGFYKMDDENYFWSLLYHALYHKGKISEEYMERLQRLRPQYFYADQTMLEQKLAAYMLSHDYFYTKGVDTHMWYHFSDSCKKRMKIDPRYYLHIFSKMIKEYIQNRMCNTK